MAVQVETITVTNAASIRISAASDSDGLDKGQALMFTPPAPILVGPPGVTAATGYTLTAGVEYTYELGDGEILHAIAPSGAANVSLPVLRTGV